MNGSEINVPSVKLSKLSSTVADTTVPLGSTSGENKTTEPSARASSPMGDVSGVTSLDADRPKNTSTDATPGRGFPTTTGGGNVPPVSATTKA